MSKTICCIFSLIILSGCSNRHTILPKAEPQMYNGTRLPKLISADDIEYPRLAQFLKLEGTIFVSIHVGSNGKVIDYKISDRKFKYQYVNFADNQEMSIGEIFDPPVIKHVQSMKFQPAIKNGKPIDIWVSQPIRWRLAPSQDDVSAN